MYSYCYWYLPKGQIWRIYWKSFLLPFDSKRKFIIFILLLEFKNLNTVWTSQVDFSDHFPLPTQLSYVYIRRHLNRTFGIFFQIIFILYSWTPFFFLFWTLSGLATIVCFPSFFETLWHIASVLITCHLLFSNKFSVISSVSLISLLRIEIMSSCLLFGICCLIFHR